MSELFLTIVDMGITASWLIVVVLLLRIGFKKYNKKIMLVLWCLVGFRLLCPFTIDTYLSVIPRSTSVIKMTNSEVIESNINNPVIINYQEVVVGNSNELNMVEILSVIWVIGIVVMVGYSLYRYVILHYQMRFAIKYQDDVYQSEFVDSPFVLGIVKPRIYLPYDIDSNDIEYVIAHEKMHLKRKDNIWKLLAFCLLIMHWFNPLVWVSYILLNRDLELSCDESVIKNYDNNQRADYSKSLLGCSVENKKVLIFPLGFCEVGVKERVKSIMNYKKPTFWVSIVAMVVCLLVVLGFLTDPKQDEFSLRINVPSKNNGMVYTLEEVSPIGNKIIVRAGEGLGDTQVCLVDVSGGSEKCEYLTTDIKVKFNASSDRWYKIGVKVQNDSEQERNVYVDVDKVKVRISDDTVKVFRAEVLANNKASLLVKPLDDSEEIKSSDKIDVIVDGLSLENITKGDIVEISYVGGIEETYPATIRNTKSVVIKEKAIEFVEDFKKSSVYVEGVRITDYVEASDNAYAIKGIVQYDDQSGNWLLAYCLEDRVEFVSVRWQHDYEIIGDLMYISDGVVKVRVVSKDSKEFDYYFSLIMNADNSISVDVYSEEV